MTIFSINGKNLQPIQVLHGNIIPVMVDFTGNNEEDIDLTILYNSNLFGRLTTIFVDNSTNPSEVVVLISGSGQTFICPPYSNGFYNIAATSGSTIKMTSVGGASALDNIQLYDYLVPAIVWVNEPTGVGTQVTILDGGDIAEGAKADAAVTNPANPGSVIALLKGILTEVISGGAGTVVTSVDGGLNTIGAKADAAVTLPANPGSVVALLKGVLGGVNATVTGLASVLAQLVTGILVTNTSQYPNGATAVTATSGVVGNAIAAATLPAVAGKKNYVSGFDVTSDGATLASIVTAVLSGLVSGSMSYVYTSVAGVTTQNATLNIRFSPAIPSSTVNTAITISLPALGAGNTAACANIHGYTL